jgi:hypothetical protein
MFCKPDVSDVLKPDVLKPDVLKPDVLWVYPHTSIRSNCSGSGRIGIILPDPDVRPDLIFLTQKSA